MLMIYHELNCIAFCVLHLIKYVKSSISLLPRLFRMVFILNLPIARSDHMKLYNVEMYQRSTFCNYSVFHLIARGRTMAFFFFGKRLVNRPRLLA